MQAGYTLDNRSHAYATACGWLKDCSQVRMPELHEPFLVKTHYPFTTLSVEPDVLKR